MHNPVECLSDVELGRVPPEVLDHPDPGGSSVRRFGRALAAASYWIEKELTSPTGGFRHPDARRTAGQLLARLERIVELLEKHPAPLNPDIRYVPPCPLCNAPAGKHWAHECTWLENPERPSTYDYRKNERIFYDQIRPLAEPLRPHPRDVYTCAVCRSRWRGKFADELIQPGDTFGEAERERLFKLIKERGLG
jgi:hypothetical protein